MAESNRNTPSRINSDTHDRLTQKLAHLHAMLVLPQDSDALDRLNPNIRSNYLHAAAECVKECQQLEDVIWEERQTATHPNSKEAWPISSLGLRSDPAKSPRVSTSGLPRSRARRPRVQSDTSKSAVAIPMRS
jgi:hypothetical protein